VRERIAGQSHQIDQLGDFHGSSLLCIPKPVPVIAEISVLATAQRLSLLPMTIKNGNP
jgi:hypothetical protein